MRPFLSTVLLSCLLFSGGIFAQGTNQVTFTVDMSLFLGGFSTVHVQGSWNNWCTDCDALTDPDGDDVWTGTFLLPSGPVQYKFVLDSGAVVEEMVSPGNCTSNLGGTLVRKATIVGNTNLDPTCWGRCGLCPETYAVTFQVDVSKEMLSSNKVWLMGDFQGWLPNGTQMIHYGNGVWKKTVQLPAGDHQYKFVYGEDIEGVPASCGAYSGVPGINNREVTVGNANMVLDVVCFGSCGACRHPLPLVLDMETYPNAYDSVFVQGSFNNWANIPLTNVGGTVYGKTLQLPAGTHQYRFVANQGGGSEVLDTGACAVYVPEIQGNARQVVLPVSGWSDTVCWSQCTPCGVPVTFQVDMRNMIDSLTFDSVFVRGTMNAFCGDCDQLTDPDGDGIYSVTLDLPLGWQLFYYSIGDLDIDEGFAGPMRCLSGDYRTVFVEGPDTLAAYCWSTCSACPGREAPKSKVLFQIEMGEEAVSADGLYVVGSFNNWQWPGTPMVNMDGNLWAVEISVLQDTTFQYRFLNGRTVSGLESVPAECGVVATFFGGYDRAVSVGTSDLFLPAPCWSSCDTCARTSTGLSDALPADWAVYPNPARSQLSVDLPATVQGTVKLSLQDLQGRYIQDWSWQATGQGQQVHLPDLPAGLYVLHMQHAEAIYRLRLQLE